MTDHTFLYCVTFGEDIEYARLMVRSWEKNAMGFRGAVIVVPNADAALFRGFARRKLADGAPIEVRSYEERSDKSHLAMNFCKVCADLYVPDALLVCHMDADMILTCPTRPSDYLVDGRPRLLVDLYANVGNAICWKPAVDAALCCDATHETMRWPMLAFVPETYQLTRSTIERLHRCPCEHYVMNQREKRPSGFAEFDTLGYVALQQQTDRYHVIDLSVPGARERVPFCPIKQGWSVQKRRDVELWHRELAEFEEILR